MPKMKNFPIVIAALAIVLSLLAGLLLTINIRETAPRGSQILDSFVQLHSLRRSADRTHIVEVAATDGTVWFREEKPGFSLNCCNLRKVYIEEFVRGEFSVLMTVQEICRNALEQWCNRRMEKMVGIVVDGEVVYAQPLHVTLGFRIAVPIFRTMQEAQEFQARILSGGFE